MAPASPDDEWQRFRAIASRLKSTSSYRLHYSCGQFVLTDVREPEARGTYYTLGCGRVGSDRKPVAILSSVSDALEKLQALDPQSFSQQKP